MEALAQAGVTAESALLGRVQGGLGSTSALAAGLGLILLVVRGVGSWRVVAGALLGALAATLVLGGSGLVAGPITKLGWTWHVTLGAFAFGTVFLATDPATTASTQTGRWLLGLLVGFLVVLIRVANPLHPDGVVFAVLLGNVFAPLLDSAVVGWHVRRRRRRHARTAG